ncbi:Vacuolar protein sorting 36 containing protein [Tritrichomonas foetus]|uniref:Vacuolar protein-sorting-associated protein 36 n=1 Tax=Tritrichomonas foetus TaxID=1144522 RepID=A0A1J4KFQ8_9EUKA|nr:Vacuolar protein sorting 36 containing protein [Tritrichomonas foetus]|eukprot:OHT10249.1 Vacuolar protein sorting 36 containing protein [Tritrichomonas foetus]
MSNYWERVQCTQYGVQLLPDEEEIIRSTDISLTIPGMRFGEIGLLVLTNQRFIFLMYMRAYALSLKIKDVVLSAENSCFPNTTDFGFIKIKCANGKEFTIQGTTSSIMMIAGKIMELLSRLNPVKSGKKKIITVSPQTSATAQNIGGMQAIIKKSNEISQERSEALKKYTKDFDSLRNAASKLKEIASQLSQVVDKDSEKDLADIYLVIGASNPVLDHKSSKSKKSDSFELQLADQFAETISKFLKKQGESFITPAEAFVVFNKARSIQVGGGDLISPSDMVEALNVIKSESKYPVHVESFKNENGKTSMIILEKGKSFNNIAEKLNSLADNEYVTSFKLSKQFGIKEEIVRWYLAKAVSGRIVAVDSSYAGDRYYRNRFDSFKPIPL